MFTRVLVPHAGMEVLEYKRRQTRKTLWSSTTTVAPRLGTTVGATLDMFVCWLSWQ